MAGPPWSLPGVRGLGEAVGTLGLCQVVAAGAIKD